MIYQFTYRGITKCRECPMCEWGATFDDYDKCNLSEKYLFPDRSDIPDDCPLVEVND